MKHLPFNPTPVSTLPYYAQVFGANVLCKRDDLFEKAGGGSKARMLRYILADVTPENCDIFVTAGGPNSNFNRACALTCAEIGVKMHLVEYTDHPEEYKTAINCFLTNMAGVEKTYCDRTCVPQTIKLVEDELDRQGLSHQFVFAGGRCLEGIFAYYDAVEELSKQVENIDHLFIVCGTGTTLTGVCAGMQKYYPKAQVHAISIARTYEGEQPVLLEDMKMLNDYLGTEFDFRNLHFYTEYLCGGYGMYSDALMATVRECISHEGMIVDTTYSGKAFWGMNDIIKKSPDEYKGKNILFWNTGGIFNLLSVHCDNLAKSNH